MLSVPSLDSLHIPLVRCTLPSSICSILNASLLPLEYRARLVNLGTTPAETSSGTSTPAANSSTSVPPLISSLGLSLNATHRSAKSKGARSKANGRRNHRRTGGVAEETSEDEFDEDDEEDEDEEDEEDEDEEAGSRRNPWDFDDASYEGGRRSSRKDDQQEEDDDEEDDDEDNEDNEDDGEVPSPDELGLNDAVKEELAALGAKARRRRLISLSRMSEYDRQGVCMRAQNAAAMCRVEQEFGTAPKVKPKPRPRPQPQADPSAPRRQSTRLNPGQMEHNSTHLLDGEQDPTRTLDGEQDPTRMQLGEQDPTRTHDGEQDPTRTLDRDQDPTRTLDRDQDPMCTLDGDQDLTRTQLGEQDPTRTQLGEQDPTRTHDGEQDPTRTLDRDQDPMCTLDGDQDLTRTQLSEQDPTRMLDGNQDPTCTLDDDQEVTNMSDHGDSRQPIAAAQGHGQKCLREAGCLDVPEVAAVNDSNWPTWLREAYNFMIAKNYGPMFQRAVQWWTVLERVYDFESAVSSGGDAFCSSVL